MALVHPIKAFKYPLLMLRRDADARVGNGENSKASFILYLYRYRTAPTIVFDRIVAEIVDDTFKQLRNALDNGFFSSEFYYNTAVFRFRL